MTARVDVERLRALIEEAYDAEHSAWRYSMREVEQMLPAILAELERGRRIEVALVKAMDTLDDFAAYARMCGRPPLANAARIAVAASLAALAQPDEKESKDG